MKCKNCGKKFMQTRRDLSNDGRLRFHKSLRDFCSPECQKAANLSSKRAARRRYQDKLIKQRLESYSLLFVDGKKKPQATKRAEKPQDEFKDKSVLTSNVDKNSSNNPLIFKASLSPKNEVSDLFKAGSAG